MAEGDVPGFLGNEDGDGVRFLGDADARAVAQPEAAVEIFARGEGENAGGGGDAVVLHDDPAVVEDGLGVEDREHEFLRKNGVEIHAGRGELADADVALDGDERAELAAREVEDRVHEEFEGFLFLQGRAEEMLAAEFGEGAAEFGLEDDDEGDGEEDREAAQEPADDVEVEQLRGQGEADEKHGEADEDFRAGRAAEVEVAIVEKHGEQGDLDRVGPVRADKLTADLKGVSHSLMVGVSGAEGERRKRGTRFCHWICYACERNLLVCRSSRLSR